MYLNEFNFTFYYVYCLKSCHELSTKISLLAFSCRNQSKYWITTKYVRRVKNTLYTKQLLNPIFYQVMSFFVFLFFKNILFSHIVWSQINFVLYMTIFLITLKCLFLVQISAPDLIYLFIQSSNCDTYIIYLFYLLTYSLYWFSLILHKHSSLSVKYKLKSKFIVT